VIGPDVALRLASEEAVLAPPHQLLAPTLLRSQLLAQLFGLVHAGSLERSTADAYLDDVRGLRIRLLGDRVLQRVAWRMADRLGWPDTLDAGFVDFEDAVLHEAGRSIGVDAIVTRDRSGFAMATLPVFTPDTFLAALRGAEGADGP
jgi:hypothetical protein